MKSRVCNIECFEGSAFVRIRSPFYVFGENQAESKNYLPESKRLEGESLRFYIGVVGFSERLRFLQGGQRLYFSSCCICSCNSRAFSPATFAKSSVESA